MRFSTFIKGQIFVRHAKCVSNSRIGFANGLKPREACKAYRVLKNPEKERKLDGLQIWLGRCKELTIHLFRQFRGIPFDFKTFRWKLNLQAHLMQEDRRWLKLHPNLSKWPHPWPRKILFKHTKGFPLNYETFWYHFMIFDSSCDERAAATLGKPLRMTPLAQDLIVQP